MINEYGDLNSLLANAGEIKQPKRREKLIEQADMARISRELVRLDDNVPVTHDWESFKVKAPDPDVLLPFLKQQNFRSLVSTMQARLGMAPDTGGGGGDAVEDEVYYELVQTEDALAAWIAEADKAGAVAVDTETTGLDSMQAKLVGVSLAVTAGRAC